MAAGTEAPAAEEFLYGTLHGDATLMALLTGGVWDTQADSGTPYPFVVFQFMSGVPFSAVGAQRIWVSMLYLVKVIADAANFDAMNAAVARIDALLHRASGTATDGTVWSCTLDQVIRLPDQVANHQYRQAGGIYRLMAS